MYENYTQMLPRPSFGNAILSLPLQVQSHDWFANMTTVPRTPTPTITKPRTAVQHSRLAGLRFLHGIQLALHASCLTW